MLARKGQLRRGDERRDVDELLRLHADGFTLVVRHAERHDPGLEELARAFTAAFAAPVNVHLYVTPQDQYGFGWHYDAEEVFILQTTGRKTYRVRKNTVNPWPLVETIPGDMSYERETMPEMRCTLEAGDWLYLPAGYWHRAETASGDGSSTSLAVGVLPATAMDVYELLGRRLYRSLLWRQRLPVLGEASTVGGPELRARLAEIFSDLGRDLRSSLEDPEFLEEFLREATRRAGDSG